ncbi:hypothetical protein LEP1GSC060_2117 [Leptospira weilii serovar Ranarum str. ICFT]|uniref:Uncharacterized protein n=1 Tax=Leptospira weilii serovar Ranarum str. ICFT TaxID=1218598 RepID=N1WIP0_9LEPT|nr:hypothetical protein LEP1GSC060_2117 [Leptospira weilii serovar Ranarum str. ICFT]
MFPGIFFFRFASRISKNGRTFSKVSILSKWPQISAIVFVLGQTPDKIQLPKAALFFSARVFQ